MKYIFTQALLAASALAFEHTTDNSNWTTVTVSPPNESCCTTGWTSGCENTIDNALSSASSYTILELQAGTYCNQDYFINGAYTWAHDYQHSPIAKLDGMSYIQITAADKSDKPKLIFDGQGAFVITDCDNIQITYLDISGPSLDITGTEASDNHDRITGRIDGGCGQYTETQCANYAQNCSWSDEQEYCGGITYKYYTGQGISVTSSTHMTIANNRIHHCPSSGVHIQESDNIYLTHNRVFGNTWWTTSASSGIAFAECEGSGTYTISNNVVYSNRNFMPFYQASAVADFGSGSDNYGTYLQDYIHDGQGIYLTRSPDYMGYFIARDNILFDNGINGISIQKTTNAFVTVELQNNTVFDNGRTYTTWESRQDAGGVVVNSGGSSIDAYVTLIDNLVTAGDSPDKTYQCYGSCILGDDSEGNTACGGSPNSQFDSSAFDDSVDCDAQATDNDDIRSRYASAKMPLCPQYTPFREADGYDCVDSTI